MQDGDATDTARSQKRETPEDTDTAQEPERRVRPRETPVGAASAAAPEPEEEVENAPAKAESNNGDAVEDKDGEDGDTVATAPPAQPRTRVHMVLACSGTHRRRAGRPKQGEQSFRSTAARTTGPRHSLRRRAPDRPPGPLGPGGSRSGDRTRGEPGADRGRAPPTLNPVPFPPY